MAKKKQEYYKDSGIVLDTSGNQIGTYKVPTKAEREIIATTGRLNPVSVQPTVSLDLAKQNFDTATNNFNTASQAYQARLANEIKKTGYDYTPQGQFQPMGQLSYQNKNQNVTNTQPNVIPIAEARKNATEEREAKEQEYNKWKQANYDYNVAQVQNEETTNWDRLKTPVRALKDLASPLIYGDDYVMKDEKGNKTYLPTYDELKQQKVRQDTTGLGGLAMDIGYNTSKILGAGAIDLMTGGIGGKALYWTDMATDNYKNVINQGYSKEQAIANTIISTGSEFLTERLLGGLAGRLTGGQASEVQNLISNEMTKVLKNPRIANILGSMGSEGLEEFVQEFIGAANDKITLGKDADIKELIKDAVYSGIVGMGSGGLTTATNNSQGIIAQQQYNTVNNQLNALNEARENTTKKSDLKKIDAAISEAQNFKNKPFTADYEKTSETINKTLNKFNTNTPSTKYSVSNQFDSNVSNEKIKAFRDSVIKENINDANGFYKAVEKIISDKDYNIVMDSSIKNSQGKSVNALISNENGITIKINPKSERAGEILLMHEVTHGIETKEMSNLIMDFASKNSEFNTALEDLKRTYGTNDVTPEVVADISGQLFGNQEFINNLSTKNPSIFRKIYDAIISIANKITGNSKEALFVKDLKNKWEKAYRDSTIKSSQKTLKESTRYSLNSEIAEMQDMLNGNVKTDKTTNNEGEKLSKGQQEFFKDVSPEVRDKNGGLKKVYHTVNHPIVQFNEFNPVGTPGYRFGNQVVIYATPSKEMSGSYANQEYEMADTRRLNSVEEAENWLFEEGLPYYSIENNTVYDDEGAPILKYKNENELLRNIKSDIAEEEGYLTKLQYEGYVNIKNPFVVESSGSDWDSVSERYDEQRAKLYDDAVKTKKQAIKDLVSESRQKQKSEYEDKNIRKSIELNSDILNNFKDDKLNNIFEKLSVGSDITELHPLLRDAKNYKDFVKRAEQYNIKLPDAKAKLFDLINRDAFNHYLGNENIKIDMSTATIEDFVNNLIKLYETEGVYGAPDRYFYFNMDKVFGESPVEEIISPAEWIEAVDEDFSKEIKEQLEKAPMTTNDVVKYVIAENLQRAENEKYDGVIFKKIFDYGGEAAEETAEDVYAVFNSNQFKAADNLNPTDDPDIRYSQDASKWQDFIEKNFKSTGTTTNLKEKVSKGPALAEASKNEKKTSEVVKDSFKTKNETNKQKDSSSKDRKAVNANEPSIQSKEFKEAQKKVKDGTATEKERSYIKTATEAQNTSEITKQMDETAKTYEVLANEETLKQAEAKLKNKKTLEAKAQYVNDILQSDKRLNASDMAAAELVLKDAAAARNVELYNEVLANLSIYATEQGQSIQALSLIRKMSPTSQLDVLEKIISREKARGNKAYNNLEITEDMRNRVFDCYDENGKVDQAKFDETMDDIKQELADNLKVGTADKIRAWRYLSMLGNPKTHVRNVVANVAMSIVKKAKDTVSATGQDIFIKDKAQKTRTLKNSSSEVKALANDTYNQISKDTVGNKYNEKSDLENRAQVFKSRWLEAVRKFNDKALSKEDQAFKQTNFKRAFANYLTAQGISTAEDIKNNPQLVEKAKLFAIEEANVATFNQENKLAQFINSGDKKLGPVYKVMRGAIIPFTRTPLNIAKTGIEYTPGAGMINLALDVYNAPKSMKANVLIDGLSKQITGTSLALLGYALAKSGRVTAGADDDKEGKFEKDQGSAMDYSIKIGDTSYDLSWLSPSSMPFFVGARMYEILDKQEGINENIILESLASTLDPLSEMSCISSFTKILQSYSKDEGGKLKDILVSTGQNYLSQFIPTVSGQFARYFDDTKRTTSADKNAPNKITQETYRQLAYKVPGLRNLLPASTDYYGQEKEEYNYFDNEGKSRIEKFYNAFLSPVNKRRDTMTEEDKELMRLYEKTGNDKIVPSGLQMYVKFNDNQYDMSRKEYNEYKKTFGDAFKTNVKELMESSDYKNASDDEKAAMVQGIMDYSKDKAKDTYLTDKGENYVKTLKSGEESPYESDKVDMLTNGRFSIADYYTYKAYAPNVINGSYADVRNRLNVINTFGIDKEVYSKYMDEIGDIKADVDSRGKTIPNSKKRKVFEYINSLDLTSEQKKLLMKKQYSTYRDADKQLFDKINNSDMTLEEKESLKNFLKIGK